MPENPLPPADECHYQVKTTFERRDTTDLFVTAEKAQAFALQQLKKDNIVKCTIKKVVPKDDDQASDGARVDDIDPSEDQ